MWDTRWTPRILRTQRHSRFIMFMIRKTKGSNEGVSVIFVYETYAEQFRIENHVGGRVALLNYVIDKKNSCQQNIGGKILLLKYYKHKTYVKSTLLCGYRNEV